MDHTLAGSFALHSQFQSRFLKQPRDVIVYLPPGYSAADDRYPVLYMHDGQNLFDAATAFFGNEWQLDETAEMLFRDGRVQPLIIVGIYNSGADRLGDYTPVRDGRGRGGRARAYGKLILDELKPFIDEQYRTLPDAGNTGLGGSSLGGLVSLYLGVRHPEKFGKLLVMSPSIWWANRAILKELALLAPLENCQGTRQKIWLDIGTEEGQITVRDVMAARDALIANGWELGRDLAFVLEGGGAHNEQAWGSRVGAALQFLFPPPESSASDRA